MPKKGFTQKTDDQVAEALIISGVIISVAANKLGISSVAVRKRVKKSQFLKDAQEEGQENGDDLAEKTIISEMQRARASKDKLLAAKIWLSRAASKRGFNVTRVALGSQGGKGKEGELRPLTIKMVPFQKS